MLKDITNYGIIHYGKRDKLGIRRLYLRLPVGAKHLLILNLNAVLYFGQQMLRPYSVVKPFTIKAR